MFRSKLERLWCRRAVIEACVKAAHEYEHIRHEAEMCAQQADIESYDSGESCYHREDGKVPEEIGDREYESQWGRVVSDEDQAWAASGGSECGSIQEILNLADSLIRAILAANESGCESKLYGIHRIYVD